MHLDKILVDEKQPADLIQGKTVIKYPTVAAAAFEFQKLSPCEQKRTRIKSGGFTYTYDEIERLCYAKDEIACSTKPRRPTNLARIKKAPFSYRASKRQAHDSVLSN